MAVGIFIGTIGQQGAKHAFELAFNNSTTTQIESEGFKQIEDVSCLIIWGEKGQSYPNQIL